MIRRAEKEDAIVIEDILYEAVRWMGEKGISNLWTYDNTRWNYLQKSYAIENFYLYTMQGRVVACMALTEKDDTYWKDSDKGEAIYLHKLAVKREASAKGVSDKMIKYALDLAREKKIEYVRLDCNADRIKLRELYERHGFSCEKTIDVKDNYRMALYNCSVDQEAK